MTARAGVAGSAVTVTVKGLVMSISGVRMIVVAESPS